MIQQHILVDLHISAEELMRWYQGQAKQVYAKSVDGRSLSFPVEVLRPFVTRCGVEGRFALIFNQQHRFLDIKKIL